MDGDEHLLRDVLGFLAIADHAQHEPEDPVLVDRDELFERARVTAASATHEPTIASIVRIERLGLDGTDLVTFLDGHDRFARLVPGRAAPRVI